jgi:Transposase domain (DUF772)
VKENPYWQHFCGEVNFQHNWPFDPTELIKFRHRLGEKGMERILKISIDLFEKKEVQENSVYSGDAGSSSYLGDITHHSNVNN